MQLHLQSLSGCLTNAVNSNVSLILKVRKNTTSISQMNFLYRTLTKREVGKFPLLFRQTCRPSTCMFKGFSWEKFGKIWNKLCRCAKILVNQQNVSIFLRFARLRKTDNQFYVALSFSTFLKVLKQIILIFMFQYPRNLEHRQST